MNFIGRNWTVVVPTRGRSTRQTTAGRSSVVNSKTPTLAHANHFAVLEVEEPSTTRLEIQQPPIRVFKNKCPELITGYLPVELQIPIFINFHYRDLYNLFHSHQGPVNVIQTNYRWIANTIMKRDLKFLVKELQRFNFTNQSIIASWHRYATIFGFHRHADYLPIEESWDRVMLRFVKVWIQDNRTRSYCDECMPHMMDLALCISDWLQWHDLDMPYTILAHALNIYGWMEPLRKACGDTAEFLPGAYGPLIAIWKKWMCPFTPTHFIVEAFTGLRAYPIQPLWELPLDVTMSLPAYGHSNKNAPQSPDDVELPLFLRRRLNDLGLPWRYNGFHIWVGTDTVRGKELVESLYHQPRWDTDGIMFAYLIQELKICWL